MTKDKAIAIAKSIINNPCLRGKYPHKISCQDCIDKGICCNYMFYLYIRREYA